MEFYWLFQWLDTTLLAEFAKESTRVTIMMQVVHLVGLATLGGMVIAGDLRLLGVLLPDVDSRTVIDNTQKGFNIALVMLIISGVFIGSSTAMKLAYNEFFHTKMVTLAIGVVFVYFVRRPLLKHDHGSINPWVLRLMAIASLTIWFTVAASGRWVGFS